MSVDLLCPTKVITKRLGKLTECKNKFRFDFGFKRESLPEM